MMIHCQLGFRARWSVRSNRPNVRPWQAGLTEEGLHCTFSGVGRDSARPIAFWAVQRTLMSRVTLNSRTVCVRWWTCTVRPRWL